MNQPHTTQPAAAEGRSVQDYLDETPVWGDGTPVSSAPLTAMQWRIWGLAAAGKFFEGLVVFMTGVALPLIAEEFGMSAFQHGLVGAASLLGILVGALTLGGLADHFGRKLMFIVEMVIFILFLALLATAPSFWWLLTFLFGVGLALGCDYPTAHLVISESIPSNARGRLVLAAFAFQAVGALVGTAIGYLILSFVPDIGAWRLMYASAIIPGIIVLVGRFFVTESSHWLAAMGRVSDAEAQMRLLLKRKPDYPKSVKLKVKAHHHHAHKERHLGTLFKVKNRRATILASVPWFLQDLSTYGIGIFTPTILAAAIGEHRSSVSHEVSDIIANDLLAAKGAGFIDLLLLVGMIVAVLLADRVGRIPLQILGFFGCAAGLLIASFSTNYEGGMQLTLIYIGFMLFNLMTNIGPNAQTYLLAGEVFPTHVRGLGAGFAAAAAKIGAVITAFLFPILLADIGTQILLYILAGTSLLGAWVTWRFQIETTGKSLEDMGQ
ncbi:MFS transporter [Aquabacter spiritensis]|uniref:Putative MFS family arabinose efflux permease n=1 Tax=Aquabacter spiritensis TaxID=933073 RepID=A0A4R3LXZ6_9HYPH|nr:MFS transporter [Aquabacter spiritensis]TCT04659.1 putative MFS family arabinose efflux permease [Aquabacter spiritensis]